ncbi:MAG: vanadium-dependent haloperoxidase [Saprospiraceae bacterium]|nr:vanadium-dependent haloperoxidase [Saprospiraceae bacterium]
MKINFLHKALFAMLLSGLFFTSCKTDENIDDPIIEEQNLAAHYNSNVASEWISLYMDVEKDLPGFRPCATSRALAYIWMSAYEAALPGMPNFVSNDTKLSGLNVPELSKDKLKYDWNVAVNAAIARTTRHFMPQATTEQLGLISDQEATLNNTLKSTVSQEVFTNSQEWGRAVADAIIAYADTDLEGVKQSLDAFPAEYLPPVGTGKWQPADGSSLFPYWGKVRTFTTFGNDLLSPPPPAYSTNPASQYYKDFVEVNENIVNLNNERRWRAEFWSDDIVGLTFSPPARQFQIANQMIQNENASLEFTVHLLLKLGMAENDAAAAAWGSKYHYNVERPFNYIPSNINPDFRTILGNAVGTDNLTPPFPGYPSGHSTFAGLSMSILAEFFGENYTFTDRCHYGRSEFIGTPRTYATMTQLGEDNAYSRIPLGVHPRFDCTEGVRLGKTIGRNSIAYNLKK